MDAHVECVTWRKRNAANHARSLALRLPCLYTHVASASASVLPLQKGRGQRTTDVSIYCDGSFYGCTVVRMLCGMARSSRVQPCFIFHFCFFSSVVIAFVVWNCSMMCESWKIAFQFFFSNCFIYKIIFYFIILFNAIFFVHKSDFIPYDSVLLPPSSGCLRPPKRTHPLRTQTANPRKHSALFEPHRKAAAPQPAKPLAFVCVHRDAPLSRRRFSSTLSPHAHKRNQPRAPPH